MSNTRIFENRIDWKVNQQSAQQVINTNRAVGGSFNDIAEAAARLGLSADQIQDLNTQLGATATQSQAVTGLLSQQSKEAAASVGFLRDLEGIQRQEALTAQQTLDTQQKITGELQRQESSAQRIANTAKERRLAEEQSLRSLQGTAFGRLSAGDENATAGRSRASNLLSGVSRAAIALPGVGYQSPLAVVPRGIGRLADASGAGLAQLALSAGIAAPAVVGVAVALDQFNRQLESLKRRLEGELQAQEAYYDARATLTSEDARARIADLQRVADLQRAQLSETRAAQEQLFGDIQSGFGDFTVVGDAVARLGDNQFGVAQLREQSEQLETQLTATTSEATRLQQGLESGEFAINDMREAEAQLAQARLRNAQQAFDLAEQQALQDIELSRLVREGASTTDADTAQQIRDTIDQRIISAREEAFAYEQLKDQADQRVADIEAYIRAAQFTNVDERVPGALQLLNDELDIARGQSEEYALKLQDLQGVIDILLPGLGLVTNNFLELNEAAIANQRALDEADLTVQAQQMTREEREREIGVLQASANALQQYINNNKLSGEVLSDLNLQYQDMRFQIETLLSVGTTYADTLATQEALLQAQEDQSDALTDSLKELQDAQQDLQQATEKTAEAYRALQETQAEHTRNLAEIDTETADKEADVRKKTGDRILEIEKQSARRILESKQQDNLNIEAAIARGDIAATQQILAQQQLRVEQEAERVKEQTQVQRDQQDEQLQAAREQKDKLLANEQERYDKELAQREEAYAKAQEQQRAANAALEAQEAAHAFTVQYWQGVVATAQNAANNAAMSYAKGLQKVASDVQAAANAINSIRINPVSSGFGSSQTRSGISQEFRFTGQQNGNTSSQAALQRFYEAYNNIAVRSGQRLPTFDDGGISMTPGFYYAGIPEAHIPLDDSRSRGLIGSGDTFVVNVDARGATMDEAQYRRITREEIAPIIEHAKADVVMSVADTWKQVRKHGQ